MEQKNKESDRKCPLTNGIFDASDEHFWKIPEKHRDSRHPGICWSCDVVHGVSVLYKGTSRHPKKPKYLRSYAVISPNETNGLSAVTYFQVGQPFKRQIREVEFLSKQSRRGTLSLADIETIEQALNEMSRGNNDKH